MSSSITLPPIDFEGERLPAFAFLLDAAAKIVSVPDETFQWFWKFCDSAAAPKEAPSSIVISHAEVLLTTLRASSISSSLDWCIHQRYPDADAAAMRHDWSESLATMIRIARSREICHWRIHETTHNAA